MLKSKCAEHGLEGVFPLDAEITFAPGDTGPERASRIFMSNVGLIKSCQGVLANMTPFRGPSADVGTAWEMGFAYALGLPIIGYTSDGRRYEGRVKRDGFQIESFDLIDNLMLVQGCEGCAVHLLGEGGDSALRVALGRMARLLKATPAKN